MILLFAELQEVIVPAAAAPHESKWTEDDDDEVNRLLENGQSLEVNDSGTQSRRKLDNGRRVGETHSRRAGSHVVNYILMCATHND